MVAVMLEETVEFGEEHVEEETAGEGCVGGITCLPWLMVTTG